MNVGMVMEALDRLGVSVQLDGADLVLIPGSKVPLDLVAAVRECKPAIVAALSRRRVPRDTGLQPLLARLRDGQRWLTANYDAYMAGTGNEPQYVSGLVQWDTLEKMLRRLYGYQGCISETGACDSGAPVWCAACAEARPWDS